jgi:hypothetical protein
VLFFKEDLTFYSFLCLIVFNKITNLEKLLNSLGTKEPKSDKPIRFVENKSALIKNYPMDVNLIHDILVLFKCLYIHKFLNI